LQFDLVEEIGRGSFGRVFLAAEPALGGRHVVVKVAPRGGDEAELLGRLHHPNIVPVYSFQEDDDVGLAAFCMPYLGRATLCDVLDFAFRGISAPTQASVILDAVADANIGFDASDFACPARILRKGSYVDGVLQLATQLADALEHSHGRGICHRDLKPSNVLVSPDGCPLLLDFNLSIDQQLQMVKIGGTIPYMAPEELAVLMEHPRGVGQRCFDPRSDLFSLGVVVYQLLTGTLPFGPIPADSSLEEVAFRLHQRQKEGPQPIRVHNSQVDARLAHLIERCLAFEPDQRPETARELVVELRKEMTPVRRGRRWMNNHRKLTGSIVFCFFAILVAITSFLLLRSPYSVRQLQLGLALNEQGKYSEALKPLSNAVIANPTSAEALFARGCAFQRLGEFQTALQDYHSVCQLASTPMSKACEGYCLSQTKIQKVAIAAYLAALKDGYHLPAVLYNNIGHSYILLGQLKDAEKFLEMAIKADPSLQTPYFNMMQVHLRRVLQEQPLSDLAFAHISRAIEIGPPTADLYYVAAAIYAKAATGNQAWAQKAIDYAKQARGLGLRSKTLATDPCFLTFRTDPQFQSLLNEKETVAVQNVRKPLSLLDPLTATEIAKPSSIKPL
jgi:serine/threonine protein kinase